MKKYSILSIAMTALGLSISLSPVWGAIDIRDPFPALEELMKKKILHPSYFPSTIYGNCPTNAAPCKVGKIETYKKELEDWAKELIRIVPLVNAYLTNESSNNSGKTLTCQKEAIEDTKNFNMIANEIKNHDNIIAENQKKIQALTAENEELKKTSSGGAAG